MNTLSVALFIWTLLSIGCVNGYVVLEGSMPRPLRAPQPRAAAASVNFFFNPIGEMEICQPATISWFFAPTSDAPPLVVLSITNRDVPQLSSTTAQQFSSISHSPPPPVRRDVTLLVNQTITPNPIDTGPHSFIWQAANVSQAGSYVIVATFPGFLQTATQTSSSFYVEEGSDTSCLVFPSSTVSNPSLTSAPTSASRSTTSTPSPSQSGVTLPVTGVSSSKVNRGAIAGGVIGGLAVLAAAIAAFFYLRYASAASSPGGVAGKRGGHRSNRRWNGLASTDSKIVPFAATSSGPHTSQQSSTGAMLSHDTNVYGIGAVGINSRPSRINDYSFEDEDEITSYISPSQEKFSSPSSFGRSPFSDPGHDEDAVPLDDITPLPGVNRNSSTSTSSHMNFSRPRSSPSSPYSSQPHSPIVGQHPITTNSSSSGHQDTSSSYPPSPSAASPEGTPIISAPVKTARRTSIGEPGSRRMPRKPVPQYNPADPALASPTPPPAAGTSNSQDSSDSSRENSLRGGRTGQLAQAGAQDWPKLSHKGSFGTEGRPMHYLIPDMPPPQPR